MRWTVWGTLLIGACGDPRPTTGDLVAVGDSYLAWNLDEGASIPEVVGQRTGLEVANRAISGAVVLGDGREAIPAQYVEDSVDGAWSWVLLDGGANDLDPFCGTPEEDAVLDALLDEDGGGAVADFTRARVDEGARVVLFGYPDVPSPTYAPCQPVLDRLRDRYAGWAAATAGVFYVDGREIVTPPQAELYDEDGVHPSVAGGEALGARIAEVIAAAE